MRLVELKRLPPAWQYGFELISRHQEKMENGDRREVGEVWNIRGRGYTWHRGFDDNDSTGRGVDIAEAEQGRLGETMKTCLEEGGDGETTQPEAGQKIDEA